MRSSPESVEPIAATMRDHPAGCQSRHGESDRFGDAQAGGGSRLRPMAPLRVGVAAGRRRR